MALSNPRNTQTFSGNGVATTFPFTVKSQFAVDVNATRTSSTGVQTKLVLNTDYSVALNADGTSTITFPLATSLFAILATGETLLLERIVPLTQATSLNNQGPYDANAVEKALDKITQITQQIIPDCPEGAGKIIFFDNDCIPQIGVAHSSIESLIASTDGVIVATNIAALKALTPPVDNTTVPVLGYNAPGDGGGGDFFFDASSTTADNGGTIIIPDAGGTGRWIRIHGQTINAKAFDAFGTGDETTELQNFLVFVSANGFTAQLDGVGYSVSATLLSISTLASWQLTCESGQAVITYTGAATDFLISSQQTVNFFSKNITFQCADLVAVPLDIRDEVTSNNGGGVFLKNIKSFNCKQTGAVTTNPTGISVIGEYDTVIIDGAIVDGVTYVNTARSATGIGVSDFGGICMITNFEVKNITTPENEDADGIKVFGTDVATLTTFLGARAMISNGIMADCEGRFIKMQISEFEVNSIQFKMSNSAPTITEWRGIDAQANNGNFNDLAFIFGTGITFSSASRLIEAQCIRNDGNDKSVFINKIRLTTGSVLEALFTFTTEFGTNSISIDDVECSGATVNHVLKHRELNLANTTKINIKIRNVQLDQLGVSLFDPFADIAFAAKLFMEFTDNKNHGTGDIPILNPAFGTFNVGGNFVFRNNIGIRPRVNWTFDMDDLHPGNSFFTGAQAVTNKGTGMGSFFHVLTHDLYQVNTDGVIEVHRTASFTVGAWNAWFAV